MTQAVSIMRSDSGMDGKDKCCCKNKYRDKMLKIVRGNDFTLNLALTRQSGADRYDSYDLTGWTPSVKIINSKTKEETIVTFTVSDNIISVPVDGELLEVGTYDIEVVMVNGEQDARSYACKQFAIVETNDEAYLPRWVEFGDYDSSIIHMPMLVQVGLSAYEIALKHGFSGSEEEWLASLKGEQGIQGDTGATGPANTLSIGTVVSGASASASISGTAPNQILNLVLPKGADGQDGQDGAAATIEIGTVTTGAAGTSASVENVGTTSAAVLNFVIPQGAPGPQGNEEDIDQNEDGKLQFANRVYNAQQPNGMGYKILRKDATFASQVTDTNTIYEIRYDFDIDSDFTMPNGCVLKFVGGSISGEGTLTFSGTLIDAENDEGIILCGVSGTLANGVAFPEWLHSSGDFANAIQSIINLGVSEIRFTGAEYTITPVINLKKSLRLYSPVGSTIKVTTTDYYRSIFLVDTGVNCDDLSISGLTFKQTPASYSTLSNNQVGRLCVTIFGSSNNVTIEKCIFDFNGTNAISINSTSIQNATIRDCTFNFTRASVSANPNYDSSSLYVASRYHSVTGNLFRSIGQNIADWVDGACESHGVSGIINNNIFNGAKACINVTNEIPQEQGETYGRTISGNVGDYCNSFVRLWASFSQPAMKNIVISSNCITNINQTAVVSVFAVNSVGGELSDILVEGNYFKGVNVAYDGTDSGDNIPKQTNVSAIKFFSIDKIDKCYIQNNVFDSWGCRILSAGYYRTTQTDFQEIWFKNNTLRNCFNGTISYKYASWESFSLFNANHRVKLVVEENTIDIPSTSTIPPLMMWVGNNSSVRFRNNNFVDGVSALYTKDSSSSVDTDLEDGINRKPGLFVLGSEGLSVVGDLRVEGCIFSKCTRAGTSNNSTLNNGKAIVNYSGVAFQCDEGASLVVGDHFNYSVNGINGSEVVIRAVVGNRFYSSSWRTLAASASLSDGTQYAATLTLRPAVWVNISVEVAGVLPTSLPIGGTYFSTGLNRPIWKNSAGNPVDAFGHKSAAFSGTTASRPTNVSVGHLYFDTNLLKYITWNGSAWVNLDGTALS